MNNFKDITLWAKTICLMKKSVALRFTELSFNTKHLSLSVV